MTKHKEGVRHAIHPLIAERWSPRSFLDRHVCQQGIGSLFEAARWRPSAHNLQPWFFLYGTKGSDDYGLIADCLKASNARWALRAPLLILALERRDDEGVPHPHGRYDVGQAAAFLTLQATALGMHVHQMAGFDIKRAARIPGVPPRAMPVCVLAVGYVGDPADLPEDLRIRENAPQVRRHLPDIFRRAAIKYA